MIIGAIPYILGCLANIDPTYGLTVPAFGLIGFGASLIWTGQAVRSDLAFRPLELGVKRFRFAKFPVMRAFVQVYMSRCATRESIKTGERQDRITSKFNGIVSSLIELHALQCPSC